MEHKPQLINIKRIIIAVIIVIVILSIIITIDTFFGRSYMLNAVGFKVSYQCKMNGGGFRGPYLENCNFSWQCRQINNEIFRDQCYFSFAKKEKNKELCEKIITESIKNSCEKYTNK